MNKKRPAKTNPFAALTRHPFWTGVGVFAMGVALLAIPHMAWFPVDLEFAHVPLETIVDELGSAFVVAAILALTLERIIVGRLTEDVRSGVEAYYLTYGLPKEFADEVMYVRDVKQARKDYTVRCRIRDGKPGCVIVEIHLSYSLINYSNKPIEYTQQMEIEEVGEDTARIRRIARSGADLSDERVVVNPGSTFRDTVKVLPNSADPRNSFEYTVEKTFSKQYGYDFLLMTQPAVNVRFVLEEKPSDLDFDVYVGHRDRSEIAVVPHDEAKIWRLDKAFFPGAGILFEWKQQKKRPQAEFFSPEATAPKIEKPAERVSDVTSSTGEPNF